MGSSLLSPVEALARKFTLPQQAVAEERPQQAERTRHYHGLVFGDLGLLLSTDSVASEIFETLPLCELPGSPGWIHAMANQRGNIIPIFDLAILLGLPREGGRRTYYLVIGKNEEAFGVLLDRLPEKISVHPKEALESRPPIPARLAPFVRRAYWLNERIWLEWEPLAFIAEVASQV